ncbi:MAG: zinc ribbon domain-containing protein [Desulfuromonas sp.]|nr:MAG: zinc ribbon domain-containing protein [Desulfuromonas sp.]
MPIYEYRCEVCGKLTEKIQRAPLAEIACPACGKTATRTVSLTSSSAPVSGGSCSVPAGSGFT